MVAFAQVVSKSLPVSNSLLLFLMHVFMSPWVLLRSHPGSPHARTLVPGLTSLMSGHRLCVHASALPLWAPCAVRSAEAVCVAPRVGVWAVRLPGGVHLGSPGLREGLWGYFVQGLKGYHTYVSTIVMMF